MLVLLHPLTPTSQLPSQEASHAVTFSCVFLRRPRASADTPGLCSSLERMCEGQQSTNTALQSSSFHKVF